MTFADVPPSVILKVISRCWGREIFSPESLIRQGLPEDRVRSLDREHQSDSKPVFRHTEDGGLEFVESMRGVWTPDLLRAICEDLGLDPESGYRGQTRIAEVLTKRIREHLKQE